MLTYTTAFRTIQMKSFKLNESGYSRQTHYHGEGGGKWPTAIRRKAFL